MPKRVLLATRDLLFRSKLGGVVAAAGADVSRDEAACDLAVLELSGPGATERIGELVRRGIPVLAYGSHIEVELLRAAREAGATAVPNSQVADRLGVLEDVHGRHPRGLRAVAVEAARHVEDPVDHRVSLEGTSGDEHRQYCFRCRSGLPVLHPRPIATGVPVPAGRDLST